MFRAKTKDGKYSGAAFHFTNAPDGLDILGLAELVKEQSTPSVRVDPRFGDAPVLWMQPHDGPPKIPWATEVGTWVFVASDNECPLKPFMSDEEFRADFDFEPV